MNTMQVVAIARKNLGGPMATSAALALADAESLLRDGNLTSARGRALTSLAYSVGVFHEDYVAAKSADAVLNARRQRAARVLP